MKKAIVFLANGFEEMEALGTVDILRRGGIEVTTVSITTDPVVIGAHNVPVTADLPTSLLPCLHRSFHSRLPLSTRVPTVLSYHSTGISTCYPSTTSFDLALGPDLPRADQLYSGNLRYSAGRILTFLSLLIPAFSLLYSPQLLIGTASSRIQCSSTNVQVHS